MTTSASSSSPASMSATAARATTTKRGERGIHIERVFNATPERLWRAMTDPALVAQWWGRGNRLVIERDELERGGHWRYVEHSEHGVHGFEGRYREVVPMQRMSRTFEWDGMPGHVSVETATFADLGDGRTRLVTDVLFLTPEDRDGMMSAGMEDGMNESFAALDRVLATLA